LKRVTSEVSVDREEDAVGVNAAANNIVFLNAAQV
jgi:hypothetical protein